MVSNYKYLVWSGTAALIVLTLFLLVLMDKTAETATTTNTVSFNGEGRVVSKPDIAVVNFTILTESPTSKAAQDENTRKSNAVMEFLKNQGIADSDVKTVGYNIYPQYFYPQFSRPTITGYQVNQSVQIKVRDLDKVSGVLDGIVSAGANQINNLNFQTDDLEALKAEAREKAINDAKEKAKVLEKQIGIRLGKIVNFSENITG